MSKLVAIHSFRGGTGKSNATASLAALLALQGKRVAVVDTDVQSPGIHLIFGLDEDQKLRTLNEYLRGECTIEDVAYPVGADAAPGSLQAQLAGKTLWLIPASLSASEISDVLRYGYDVNRLNAGLQSVRKSLDLDFLLIDTHPGLHEETLLSFAFSDILLVILRLDRQDLQGTAVTVDIARSLDVPHLLLVVNKVLARYDEADVRREVSRAFAAPVVGVLPLSEEMAALQSSNIFALRFPDHPWSLALKEVAAQLQDIGGER